jgi:hypothetical protein
MKRSMFVEQVGGLRIGRSFHTDPATHSFTITAGGLRDSDGFDAVELTYDDGTKEVAAIQCLRDALDGLYENKLICE